MTGAKLMMLALLLIGGLGALTVGGLAWAQHQGWVQAWGVPAEEENADSAYMRANLDAMARRLGEMQARLIQVDSLGARVAELAGLDPEDFKVKPGEGGALMSVSPLSAEEFGHAMDSLDEESAQRLDWLTYVESRLFEQQLQSYLVPTQEPVEGARIGSPFGYRIDPINGRKALHTGLDFPADTGTPILAAAGGVVVVEQRHPAYGNMVEIDHGNKVITRYAHASKVFVKKGDLVKRGQHIADVGSTGRSTGPHLHFEVWVAGTVQNPRRFLDAGEQLATISAKR
ncbi:M23 family metallopeptidase [Hydrogenophaga sp. 5NK40-0174]|uniref:M23 family metallopeptidase n=1 Tax=Hydrogenophaga sp. 5NK40-0174 TaxID=3127649 RepID=UPI003341F28B